MAFSSTTYDVIVRNYNPAATVSNFRALFEGVGPVMDVHITRPVGSRNSPATYVRYAEEAMANTAAEKFHQTSWMERTIEVMRVASRNRDRASGPDRSRNSEMPPRFRTGAAGYGGRSGRSGRSNTDFPHGNGWASKGSFEREPTSVQVMVVHVDQDMLLWAQVHKYGAAELLDGIVADLQKACQSSDPVESVEVGNLYAGLYPADGQWYRCKVLEVQKTHVTVRYVDFGNGEMLQLSQMKALPPDLATKEFLATPFLVSGVGRREIPAEALEKVRDLVQERDLHAVIKVPGTDGQPPVISLHLLNKEDVTAKILEVLKEAGVDLPSAQAPKTDEPVSQTSSTRDSSPKTRNSAAKTSDMERSTGGSPSEHRRETEQKAQSRNKALENEQRERKALEAQLNDLKKSPLQWRMSQLMSHVEKLRQVRSTVPSSSSTNDVLERAIDVATQDNPCLTPSLDAVLEAEQRHSDLQTELRELKPDDAFQDTVVKRNSARQEFLAAASSFLDKASKLPIADHLSKLEQTTTELSALSKARHPRGVPKSHRAGSAELSALIEQYRKWKAERLQQVEDVQQATNTCCGKLGEAFHALQTCLCTPGEVSAVQFPRNLDELAVSIEEAIKQEIEHTKKSEQECSQPGGILDDVSMVRSLFFD